MVKNDNGNDIKSKQETKNKHHISSNENTKSSFL